MALYCKRWRRDVAGALVVPRGRACAISCLADLPVSFVRLSYNRHRSKVDSGAIYEWARDAKEDQARAAVQCSSMRRYSALQEPSNEVTTFTVSLTSER